MREEKVVDAEVAEGILGVGAHGLEGEILRPTVGFIVAAAELGGDVEFGGGGLEKIPDGAFAVAHAVDIGGVDEIHAALDGAREDGLGVGGIDLAPVGAAELPSAEADFGDCGAGVAQCARVHGC